ncbi:MAG TPA: carboxypeptidase regulatory-like domain-containing protein [Polyangiaceae bacterium]|nr:carboxypeptidase regulatory-like domain-containing protein [Polyangiaceae bacterium]
MDASRRSEAFAVFVATLAAMLFLATIPASVDLRRTVVAAAPAGGAVARASSVVVVVRRSPDGAPLSAATVRAFWGRGERYYLAGAAVSDGRGVAELASLPAGATWLLVEAPGYARASLAISLEAGRRDVQLLLEPARALSVRVETETGTTVAGATVLVTSRDALPYGALTANDGVASLGRLGAPPYKLRVAARGFEQAFLSDVLADTTVRLHPASSLEALVVDGAGKPVPHATVLVAGSGLWPARRLESGADGRARITSLTAGAYDLKAEMGSLVSRTEVGVHLDRGEARAIKLVLGEGRMVPIVVSDGDGDHPLLVPNADVLLVEGGVSSFPLRGRTNAFGRVTLGPAAPGQLVAAARADGFVAKSTVAVPDVIAGDVRIPLLRGGTLRGDVVDKEGRPIGGATVEIVGTDLDGMPIAATPLSSEFQKAHFAWALAGPSPLLPAGELGVTQGPVPPIPNGPSPPVGPMEDLFATGALSEPWVTSQDGAFRATPVPPGRVRALVRHPSFVEAASDMVTLAPGSGAVVRVVMDSGGVLEGTVVDETDLPVAGARVEAVAALGTADRTVTTADDGTFSLPTLPSDVLVTVARPTEPFRAVVRRRLAVPNGKTTEVKLTLPAPRGEIEIEVEDDSSRPIRMAQISATSLDPDQPLRETAFTDDSGRAIVKDATGLPLRLVIEAPGFARFAEQTDAAPATFRVTLATGVAVEGHVTAVRGRRDVSGASVELVAEGHRKSAVTNASGEYHFDDVSPGRVHLTVSHPDYASVEADVVVAPTGRADRAFDVDAVDLPDPGVIEGRVVDGAGNTVAGARVAIGAVDAVVPVALLSPSSAVSTRADGSFRIERARPGKLSVEAYAAGVGRGHAAAVVESGRTTADVVIRLTGSVDDTEPVTTGGVAVTLAMSPSGVVVAQVAPGSEAEHGGLVQGDVVELVDRAALSSVADARQKLSGPEGSDVVVTVRRESGRVTLRLRRERVR